MPSVAKVECYSGPKLRFEAQVSDCTLDSVNGHEFIRAGDGKEFVIAGECYIEKF